MTDYINGTPIQGKYTNRTNENEQIFVKPQKTIEVDDVKKIIFHSFQEQKTRPKLRKTSKPSYNKQTLLKFWQSLKNKRKLIKRF